MERLWLGESTGKGAHALDGSWETGGLAEKQAKGAFLDAVVREGT